MSSLGRQLDAAELYSTAKGKDGELEPVRKVDRHAVGYTVIPVKPTRRHALSNPSNDQEERLVAEGEANRKLATLTVEERQVVLLQSKRYVEVREIRVPADEAALLLEGGWFLVRQENGEAVLSGEFVTEMTQDQIGQLLGVSASTVCRRLKSAFTKLRRGR